MTNVQFEQELKAIDPRLAIVNNQNLPQLANIKLNGSTVCVIPANEIREEPDENYFIVLPNGDRKLHRSYKEAIAIVHSTLEKINSDKEYHDQFFGLGEYRV